MRTHYYGNALERQAGIDLDQRGMESGDGLGPARAEEKFAIALGAGDWRRDRLHVAPSERGNAFRDFFDGKLVHLGIANDSAFANVSPPRLELRFDENKGLGERRCRGKNGTEQECRRDKGDVHGEKGQHRITSAGKRTRREKTCVGALDETDARIIAKLHGNLAEARVDGRDMSSAVLQKAIGESAGRSTDIETVSSRYFDLPMRKGRLKFQASAAHVAQIFSEQAHGGILRNGCAGLVDLLFADQNATGQNHCPRPLTAGDETTLDEQHINAHFCSIGQGSESHSRFQING